MVDSNIMTLIQGFLGGLLIGGASAIMLLGAGEIMGFSGIISSVFKNPIAASQDPAQQWKLAFLSTFMLSAYAFLYPTVDSAKIEAMASVTSVYAYGLSGLFVGFGTKLGNGCTSGHGICGMARLSKRSIAAVFTFMGAAIVTAVVTSRGLAIGDKFDFLRSKDLEFVYIPYVMHVVVGLVVVATLYGMHATKTLLPQEEADKRIPAAAAGIMAAGGLTLSKMVYPNVVLAFLDVSRLGRESWDPTLMMVMMGAVVVSFFAYQFVPGHALVTSCPKMEKPMSGNKFGVPTNQIIDWKLVVGAIFFGIGWGISGLCPGPALLLTMKGVSGMILLWWPAFYVGMRVAEVVKDATAASPSSSSPSSTGIPQSSKTQIALGDDSKTQEFQGGDHSSENVKSDNECASSSSA